MGATISRLGRLFIYDQYESQPRRHITCLIVLIILSIWIGSVVGWGMGLHSYGWVDFYTILAQGGLALLLIGVVFYWARTGEPLSLLLVCNLILFFYSRPTTLLFFPQSAVLNRFPIAATDITNALLVVIAGAASLFLGVCMARRYRVPQLGADNGITFTLEPKTALLVSAAIWFIPVFFFTVPEFQCPSKRIPWVTYISLFFDLFQWVILGIIVIFHIPISIAKRFAIGLAFLLIYIAVKTALGSRSGVFGVIMACIFFGALSYSHPSLSKTILPLKNVVIGIICGLILLAPISFLVGTSNRTDRMQDCVRVARIAVPSPSSIAVPSPSSIAVPSPSSNRMEKALVAVQRPLTESMASIAERMGGLDNTTHLLAYSDRYRHLISFSYYFHSIADGLIIGSWYGNETLRAALMLRTVYRPETIDYIYDGNSYQSDVMTQWAEAVILFGQPLSYVMLFLAGYGFSSLFQSAISKSHRLSGFMGAAFVLYIWSGTFFEGFGLDWVFFSTIQSAMLWLAAFYLIRFLFREQCHVGRAVTPLYKNKR